MVKLYKRELAQIIVAVVLIALEAMVLSNYEHVLIQFLTVLATAGGLYLSARCILRKAKVFMPEYIVVYFCSFFVSAVVVAACLISQSSGFVLDLVVIFASLQGFISLVGLLHLQFLLKRR